MFDRNAGSISIILSFLAFYFYCESLLAKCEEIKRVVKRKMYKIFL